MICISHALFKSIFIQSAKLVLMNIIQARKFDETGTNIRNLARHVLTVIYAKNKKYQECIVRLMFLCYFCNPIHLIYFKWPIKEQ